MIFCASRPTSSAAYAFSIELNIVRTLCAVAFVALTLVGCSSRDQTMPEQMSVGARGAHLSSWRPPLPPYIVVQPGDTLHGIARRHNLSVYGFETVNNLAGPQIYPGQKLFLPTH